MKNDVNLRETREQEARFQLAFRRQTRINYFIITVFALVAGILIGNNLDMRTLLDGKLPDDLDTSPLQSVYNRLSQDYDGEIDKDKLIEGSIKGLVAGLEDDHSVYMTREEARRFKESLTGDIGGGIGAEIGVRSGYITIIRPLKNNPAINAGVEAGDVVLKVNDEEVTGQDLETVVMKIRGPAGSTVKLSLAREGRDEAFDIEVTRAIVDNPSVDLSIKDGVAIITLYRFDEKTVALMKKASQEILSSNAKSIILDLRDNSGGLLTAAQGMAGLWIDGQVVLTQKQHGKVMETIYAPSGQAELGKLKTIVLINENSASASEILAAALRDHGKAQLLGVKTYGKGSVQELSTLARGGQLKLTVAHWFTPKDQTIEKVGIEPDVEVKRSLDDIKNDRDPQLDKALELLK